MKYAASVTFDFINIEAIDSLEVARKINNIIEIYKNKHLEELQEIIRQLGCSYVEVRKTII